MPSSGHRRSHRSAGEEGDQRSKKRAKVAEDDMEVLGVGHTEDDSADPNGSSVLFVPDFECSDGHVLTVADSLAERPFLPMTLLKELALPKDMESLPAGKANNMAKLCLFLAKVNQNGVKVATDLIEVLEVKVAEAAIGQEERDWLLIEIKDVKAERDRLKEEKKRMEDDLPRQLEEAKDPGYNEVDEYYKQQVEGLVKRGFKDGELKGIKDTNNSSFLRRYQVSLDYAEVPEDDHRREPPVVPLTTRAPTSSQAA
ncbi:hypothetical protein RHMOL_Rhmol01G0144300 [Rhododendron molle]|uniref:Uncharacterized protein n=1 Tax=Rhododendron molle TaxID=49168 RepID=A0ACC0Q4G2_RHOML|nr:hypothetical protein RHMOL_Rhmol01G0144300 [Rhododendron molle]